MNILIIDNYDSFTYNLVQLVRNITGTEPTVKKNDQFTLAEVAAYDKILLSPGPGIPSEAGLLPDVIKAYAADKSILGVCLGHQAVGEAFGATLTNMSTVHHGVSDTAYIATPDALFQNLPVKLEVGRYHSWAVALEDFPTCLQILAHDAQGTIMAIRHKEYEVYGVQFHPESILTPDGKQIITNWINL